MIVYIQRVTSKHPVSHAVNLMHKPRCRNQVKTVIGQRASDNIYTMIEVELLGNQKNLCQHSQENFAIPKRIPVFLIRPISVFFWLSRAGNCRSIERRTLSKPTPVDKSAPWRCNFTQVLKQKMERHLNYLHLTCGVHHLDLLTNG